VSEQMYAAAAASQGAPGDGDDAGESTSANGDGAEEEEVVDAEVVDGEAR